MIAMDVFQNISWYVNPPLCHWLEYALMPPGSLYLWGNKRHYASTSTRCGQLFNKAGQHDVCRCRQHVYMHMDQTQLALYVARARARSLSPDRQTERDRQRDRQRERDTDRHTERETERDREREREREKERKGGTDMTQTQLSTSSMLYRATIAPTYARIISVQYSIFSGEPTQMP